MLLILTDLVTTSPTAKRVFRVRTECAGSDRSPTIDMYIFGGGGGGGDTRQHFIFAHRDSTP